MAERWRYLFYVSIGMLISITQSQQIDSVMPAGITITSHEQMKKIEINTPSNLTSYLPTPTMIQQGNNLFIKPKIILSSPFTSYKEGFRQVESVPTSSKISGRELNTVIGKSEIQQLPTIVVPPPSPMVIPTRVEDDIAIHCPMVSCRPQVTITPNLLQPNKIPIVAEKPVRPIIIPEAPKLPPMILPKLPIQVVVEKPMMPIPNHHIIVQSLCPPTAKCVPTEKNLPSFPNDMSGMLQKFQNLLTVSNKIDLTKVTGSDELVVTSDLPVAFPTLCVQEIIAERVIPNIIKNDDVKVIMTPISVSQLEQLHFYRK